MLRKSGGVCLEHLGEASGATIEFRKGEAVWDQFVWWPN